MLTLDHLQRLEACQTIADVRETAVDLAREIGFMFPTYAMYVGPGFDIQENTLVVNFPEAWAEHYLANRYEHVDPVVMMARRSVTPFAMSELPQDLLGPEQQRVLDEAREFRFFDGVVVPLRAPGGMALLSCVADGGPRQRAEVVRHNRADVAMLALAVHNVCQRLFALSGDSGPLTPRERDCVHWLARGKDTDTIGEILEISGNTVAQHLKAAMRKLGCSNRVSLAVRAVQMGIISAS